MKAFVNAIAAHPGRAGAAIAVLSVLTLIMVVMTAGAVSKYKACARMPPPAPASAMARLGGAARGRRARRPEHMQSGKKASWTGTGCSQLWDPAAVAEAQAMAVVGAMDMPSPGERRLEDAVDNAYDLSEGLNDAQLGRLSQYGMIP